MNKKKKPLDPIGPIVVSLMRRAFNLNFPSGGFTIEFPAQQAGIEYPNVCTNLSQGNFSILFPNNITVTIPCSDREIALNGEPFQLPSSESGRLVVQFPNGGTICFPSGTGTSLDASMDPLPGTGRSFEVEGNGATVKEN